MITLISKAYTSIRLQDVIAYLGLSEAGTLEKIHTLGWSYDADSGFVKPEKLPTSLEDSSPVSFDDLMTKLSDYVQFLEN